MMRAVYLLALVLVFAPPARGQRSQISPQEQEELSQALAEAGSSPVEYLRAIEKHLAKYPNSPRKTELERAAARAAIEAGDDRRIVLYGERVLARQPDDLQMLERVTHALLAGDSKANAPRALELARHYEELLRKAQADRAGDSEWQNQTDRAIGRALSYQARATGNLGKFEEALPLAQRAFATWPSAASARETALCEERLNRFEDAARAMADAFTVADPDVTEAARAADRTRMGDLYRKAKGSEAGLGDLVLQAYDRNLAAARARELKLRAGDPNANLTDPMEFTLRAAEGASLQMASLKGKVVIFDFWATWCTPCRAQHPLYEEVKKRFRDNPDVVFLSVATDDDHAVVAPFLKQTGWAGPAYFEDGLSRALKITSIPTTILIDRHGRVASRLNGFVPERFVDMLTERIRDALAN